MQDAEQIAARQRKRGEVRGLASKPRRPQGAEERKREEGCPGVLEVAFGGGILHGSRRGDVGRYFVDDFTRESEEWTVRQPGDRSDSLNQACRVSRPNFDLLAGKLAIDVLVAGTLRWAWARNSQGF